MYYRNTSKTVWEGVVFFVNSTLKYIFFDIYMSEMYRIKLLSDAVISGNNASSVTQILYDDK